MSVGVSRGLWWSTGIHRDPAVGTRGSVEVSRWFAGSVGGPRGSAGSRRGSAGIRGGSAGIRGDPRGSAGVMKSTNSEKLKRVVYLKLCAIMCGVLKVEYPYVNR